MTLKCGCEGDVCQGHSGELLGVTIITKISYKELWALQQVARKAKIAEDVLERVTESFPDNETPHPSIEECLNIYCDLAQALKELENYWKVNGE